MLRRLRLRTLGRFRRASQSLARDTNGATAVEFAMISVPFLGLLFAIFQTAYLFLSQQAVDAGAAAAQRNIMTGQTMAAGTTTAANFCTSVIQPAMPSFLNDCTKIIVDVRTATWASNDTTQDILNGGSKFCIGNPGDVVIVRVVYPVPAFLSIMALTSTGAVTTVTSGQQSQTSTSTMVYPLMGVTAFKNEPFTASTYTVPTNCP